VVLCAGVWERQSAIGRDEGARALDVQSRRRGEAAVEGLLEGQRRYYSARAPEYDDRWLRRGRHALDQEAGLGWFADVAELERQLDEFAPRGDVLELAAGTETWTRHLVGYADRVTALDAAPEVLELNEAKTAGAAEYVRADIFAWEPPRAFDSCVFGFWLSHVPSARFAGFWSLLDRALEPGGPNLPRRQRTPWRLRELEWRGRAPQGCRRAGVRHRHALLEACAARSGGREARLGTHRRHNDQRSLHLRLRPPLEQP
jgi:SAM-dependent methyltransferase